MAKSLTTVPGSQASFFHTDCRVRTSKFLRALPDFKETERTQPLYCILSADVPQIPTVCQNLVLENQTVSQGKETCKEIDYRTA